MHITLSVSLSHYMTSANERSYATQIGQRRVVIPKLAQSRWETRVAEEEGAARWEILSIRIYSRREDLCGVYFQFRARAPLNWVKVAIWKIESGVLAGCRLSSMRLGNPPLFLAPAVAAAAKPILHTKHLLREWMCVLQCAMGAREREMAAPMCTSTPKQRHGQLCVKFLWEPPAGI